VYYKDAFGAVLVFDLSREETFTNVLKVRQRGRAVASSEHPGVITVRAIVSAL
jgi:hypothetical protein